MATVPERNDTIRSRMAARMFHPPSGWWDRRPALLRERLLRPAAALVVCLIALGLLGFLTAIFPERAGALLAAQILVLLTSAGLIGLILTHVRRHLVEPLAQLRDWAQRLRAGDLSARIPVADRGEFAELVRDVNTLSDRLKALTIERNRQVRAQTVRLARKTQSLDVLYDVASSLNQPGDLDKLLESFLDTFIELVDARAAAVRLVTGNNQTRLVASRGLDPAVVDKDRLIDTSLCQCGWAATKGGIRVQRGTHACAKILGAPMLPKDCTEFVVVPVQYQDRILGVYNLFLDRPLSALGEDMHDLLTSIGRHLGLAIEKARLDTNARRLAIMEERNAIGNELHDSLAQSLVGLRLQAKMLREFLDKRDHDAAQHEVRRMRDAIEEAHTSLRELLANFRLKIDDRGLESAVRAMVERFRHETGVAVFFQNECHELNLVPAQEIQVFYIIQEALTNIRKHSNARNVRILLNNEGDLYTVLIEDDGLGMAEIADAQSGEHIGLSVMRERAARLPGELVIESEPGEGTRLVLIFTAPPSAHPARAAAG